MGLSKSWKWEMLAENQKEYWRNPSEESYYLVNRWKTQGKRDFLDLGCGLGRHSILFGKNAFNVRCFDLSEEALKSTRKWAEEENLLFQYSHGDMLDLPYNDDSVDCIMCINVISHSDTAGVEKAISEIGRVLKADGECFLTLASKESWGYMQEDWPLLDKNTRLRMDNGPENGIPHFYADYEEAKSLFSDFETVNISHVKTYYEHDGNMYISAHFHILIKKWAQANLMEEVQSE